MKQGITYTVIVLLTCLVSLDFALCDDYQTGPGDVLKITVYDNADLGAKVRISDAGTIVLPLLGKIDINKLTIDEITERLTTLLADGYLVHPQVNVFVEEYRSKKVVVLGSIRRPGIVELTGAITFLELISRSGGLGKDAGGTATIQRTLTDGDKIDVIDLLALLEQGDLSQNLMINDGDTVFISKAGMCYITGEVGKPGTYPCGDKATVLKLIALSGGFTGKASKSGVNIVRIVDNKKTVIEDVDLSLPLQHNDVVVVPESFF